MLLTWFSFLCMLHFCISIQKVISAQQLPKLNKDKHKSIVDPLVRVELYGVPADNASKETHYIENNGDHNFLSFFFFSEQMSRTLARNKLKIQHISELHQLINNQSLQGSTQCGMRDSSLTSTFQSWSWCDLWRRTMTQHLRMISSGSTAYRSPVYRMVRSNSRNHWTGDRKMKQFLKPSCSRRFAVLKCRDIDLRLKYQGEDKGVQLQWWIQKLQPSLVVIIMHNFVVTLNHI